MKNKTNLQRFAELFSSEEGINEFILENFNNQDSDKYVLNDIEYHLFNRNDVQDQLDEDFDWEITELCEEIRMMRSISNSIQLANIIENRIDSSFNYKTVDNDYSDLRDYCFQESDGELYVYTKY